MVSPGAVKMKVVNAYLPHSDGSRGYQYPGVGDFLRGSVCLHQICQELELEFEMNFSKHPLESTLAQASPVLPQATTDIQFFPVTARGELIETLQTAQAQGESAVVLFTNCVPRKELNERCRREIVARLAPSAGIAAAVSRFRVAVEDYDVLHVRLTDAFFSQDESVSPGLVDAVRAACAESRRRLVVLSNSVELKRMVEGWGVQHVTTVEGSPRHSGYASDLEATMIHFHVMAGAGNIFQLSEYSWGSGFSEWCARLHSIPLVRLKRAAAPSRERA